MKNLRVFKAGFCYNNFIGGEQPEDFLRKKVAQMTATKGINAGRTMAAIPVKEGAKSANQEICHPSVCVGNTKPANCVCPTNK
jgi:hypothetical protein